MVTTQEINQHTTVCTRENNRKTRTSPLVIAKMGVMPNNVEMWGPMKFVWPNSLNAAQFGRGEDCAVGSFDDKRMWDSHVISQQCVGVT